MTIHLSGLPVGRRSLGGTGRPCPLLGLAPGGGCQPPRSPSTLVRSYRTVSPLPVPCSRGAGPSAVCSLLPWTVRSLRPGSRQHPALWSPDLPRSARTSRSDRGHPADSPTAPVSHPSSRAASGVQVVRSGRCRGLVAKKDTGRRGGRAPASPTRHRCFRSDGLNSRPRCPAGTPREPGRSRARGGSRAGQRPMRLGGGSQAHPCRCCVRWSGGGTASSCRSSSCVHLRTGRDLSQAH